MTTLTATDHQNYQLAARLYRTDMRCFTFKDLCNYLSRSETSARRYLKELQELGLVVQTHRYRIQNTKKPIPIYTFTPSFKPTDTYQPSVQAQLLRKAW